MNAMRTARGIPGGNAFCLGPYWGRIVVKPETPDLNGQYSMSGPVSGSMLA